ncbi:MAG: NAD(P)-dependent oxidoreductase [Calditrichaeota bacterium]|nr:NAD(P)-dependent oxidoreductase [Calditrichota bacterium]
MKVLVTGVSGFIGRHVAERLVNGAHELVGIVRPGTAPERIAALRDRMELEAVDLGDLDALRQFLSRHRFEVILHIGALRGARPFPREVYQTVNVEATRVLLQHALAQQARFIFCSSVGVFGAIPRSLPADDATPRQPDTFYHFTKIEAERWVLEFVKQGLEAVIVRPSITYGEGDYGFPYTLVRLVDRRMLLLPFREVYIHLTHVAFLVQVFEKLVTHPIKPGAAYIVADKSPVSLWELADFIHQELHGKPYPSMRKLPGFLFDLAAAFFHLLRNEAWRTRFQLISRSWYYSIENTLNDLQVLPVATIPAFKTVTDWYKRLN